MSVNPSAVFDDIPESMPSGSDDKSELSKVTEILLNEQWGRRKTNIRQQLISAITTLDTIGHIYDISFLQEWIPSYCEYLTSVEGKGRQDIVDITRYRLDQETERFGSMMEMMGKR